MKYMGSKKFMLNNGLGKLIRENIKHCDRFVDPFCGSGAVVFFVAEKFDKPILAADLQQYSTVLARSVIGREKELNYKKIKEDWINEAKTHRNNSSLYKDTKKIENILDLKKMKKDSKEENRKREDEIKKFVNKSRKLCKKPSAVGPIWNAYGGHYFSPSQSLAIDYLIKYLPKKEPHNSVCLAALIETASKCVASPGHTAQPFQPKGKSAEFILQSWNRDIFSVCENSLEQFSNLYARKKGKAIIADAQDIQYKKGDLIIIDPPYSGVHYSRFYHVLETIARGKCGPVTGVGRYPDLIKRPQSKYSNISQAKSALEKLLKKLSQSEAMVIFTFPKGKCSNGLSGDIIKSTAKKWFDIEKQIIHGHFSTLGGNNNNRSYRIKSEELLLLLKPKNHKLSK